MGEFMLKIMTLNANYYGDQYGPWPVRREMIREAILQSDPDILALQAVRMDPEKYNGVDQASQLAELLSGYEYVVYQPAVKYEDGITEGSAFVSRLKIQATDRRPLTLIPDLEDSNHRVVLKAVFELQGEAFHLYNAHFSWVSEQAQKNVQEALDFFKPVNGSTMLVGDLNTIPESTVFRPFHENGLIDAWRELRPGENGYTFVEGGDFSKRIDYAWLSPDLRERLQSIEIVANETTEAGARPSDHAGLLITLAL
jgi:endonuclease/exonuclease/phosphatase family metal-dependent hydrolase